MLSSVQVNLRITGGDYVLMFLRLINTLYVDVHLTKLDLFIGVALERVFRSSFLWSTLYLQFKFFSHYATYATCIGDSFVIRKLSAVLQR